MYRSMVAACLIVAFASHVARGAEASDVSLPNFIDRSEKLVGSFAWNRSPESFAAQLHGALSHFLRDHDARNLEAPSSVTVERSGGQVGISLNDGASQFTCDSRPYQGEVGLPLADREVEFRCSIRLQTKELKWSRDANAAAQVLTRALELYATENALIESSRPGVLRLVDPDSSSYIACQRHETGAARCRIHLAP